MPRRQSRSDMEMCECCGALKRHWRPRALLVRERRDDRLAEQRERLAFLSDRRLCLTADYQTVVEDGDPRAAFLLVGKGGAVSVAMAERYGLQPPPLPEDE